MKVVKLMLRNPRNVYVFPKNKSFTELQYNDRNWEINNNPVPTLQTSFKFLGWPNNALNKSICSCKKAKS